MPKDRDFKRLVRARMDDTGERYTRARAALGGERGGAGPLVSDRTRSILGQLADTELAESARRHLERLPEPERRAAATEGLRHPDWRARRTSARLLDRVDLTAESVAALTRALRERWDTDDRRRRLSPDLVRKTERHQGRWVIIRDGRIIAVDYGRDLDAGARRYWVAPADARRPRIP